MPTYKKKSNFSSTQEEVDIEQELQLMDNDARFNTAPSFAANSELYPDNLIPFVEKHMAYLNSRNSVNPQQYISNLRLITRIRS